MQRISSLRSAYQKGASGQQMRLEQGRALVLEELVEDLAISEALVDFLRQVAADVLGHAAGVGVATGQRVEVARAAVAGHAAGAVDAGQEPVDALLLGPRPIDVGWHGRV